MGENNKILDVKYGNFSCRLEGFDDSVETMKSVVGYFQELSGDAIFSDGRPAIPNVDEIARLASEHNNSGVSVERDENGLRLKVTSRDASETPEIPQQAYASIAGHTDEDDHQDDDDGYEEDYEEDEDAIEGFASETFDDDTFEVEDAAHADDGHDEEAGDDSPAAPAPFAPAVEESDTSVADKLQRIRAVVGRGAPPKLDDSYAAETAENAKPKSINPLAQRLAELAKRNAEPSAENAPKSTPLILVKPDETAEAAPEETKSNTSQARNAGVAALILKEAITRDADDAGEDDDAPDMASDFEDDLEERVLTEEEAVQPIAADDDAADDVDSHAEMDADLPADDADPEDEMHEDEAALSEDAPAEDAYDAEAEAEVAYDTDVEDAPSDVLGAPEAQDDDAAPELHDHDAAPDVQDDDVADASDLEDDAVETAAQAHDTDADDQDTDAGEELAADDDLDASDDAGDAQADEDTDVAEDTPAPRSERAEAPLLLTTRHQPITVEDDDEDFDLQEEVAKIERELASRPGNELARHGLPRTVEDAMSRILMKTDLELDMQETRDGRDAFAQLKAAVAATEAARQLGDQGAKSRDVSAMFRDDFGAIEGTENADGSALPPLKLVEPVGEPKPAKPTSENTTAVRLREIADITKANSTEAEPLTFADFAAKQGATELVDKIEAAAAYLAFVEGESDFSRPQVMRVVQTASKTEVTREDGLRCFGRLLRQARVTKLNNGRFQISDSSRFRPTGGQAARG